MTGSKHRFAPQGVCAEEIYFELEGGNIHSLRFQGGCSGNLKGIARLAEGRPARELIELLAGLPCGNNETSCPDQLARSLTRALKTSSPCSTLGSGYDA